MDPAPGTAPVVEVIGASRSFHGHRALDGVDLRIGVDSIVGLLGRNGAGKTSLMSLLTAQDFPTSGTVRIFGEDPVENEAVLSRTCFIRENQQYPNNFNVRHVLAAGANFYPRWDAALAERLVRQFDLPTRRRVHKLSRGMRAAAGIIVGLASRAELTIFDEPYLGLDATARQMFYDLLLEQYAEEPRTVILSTHLIDEISGLLEDVFVLDQGRIVLEGSADDLRGRACVLSGPVPAVDALVGGLPLLHREEMGGFVRATVDVRPDHDLRREAAAIGVDVGPVSLQSLVVRAGLGDGAGSASTAAARRSDDELEGAPR